MLEDCQECHRLMDDIDALKHDIERHLAITSEQAAEIQELRTALAAQQDVREATVEQLDAAFRQATAAAWQPIETAPKDGTHVLVAWADTWPKHPHAEAMYYDEGGWWYWHSYDGDGHTRPPTHWMPLPAPRG